MAPLKPGVLLLLALLSLLASIFHFVRLERVSGGAQRPLPRAPERPIRILLWRWPFGRAYSLSGDKCLELYNVSGCLLSDDPAEFAAADVVVFHHREVAGDAPPPALPRPASQRWVWMSLEPPVNNANVARLNGLFNWTMSYRRDADVPIPYGETLAGGGGGGGGHFLPAANRSCLVGWVVSKYRPGQARSAMYQRLKEHIPVQVYGRWAGRPLAERDLLPTIGRCLFYLSFENSEATDYVSEKLWRNAFQAGAIPVVLGPGRATYEALAPPGSFVHVGDFASAAQLAAHLRGVAADGRAVQGYHRWRATHRVRTVTDWRERLCRICVRYRSLPDHMVYQDLESWVNH